MKFNQKFNEQEIDVMPTKTTEMGIDEKGMAIAMKMVTSDLYSNPIGSVVREIASNAVDSHVEAISLKGVESHLEANVIDPIKIKLTYEESGVYVSFQDFGVGMTPKRVETVYGKYYSSTKRDNNDEIGGFGIGGKSPMAYGDSFFVITIADKKDDIEYTKSVLKNLSLGLEELNAEHDKGDDANASYLEHLTKKFGSKNDLVDQIAFLENRLAAIKAIKEERVEYHYNIFKGENAPVIQELFFHGTTAHKGTEVKIPVRKDDVSKFAHEIKRQLYYFNNVVFEGWDGNVTDDYTIYKGKSFVYRGSDYEHEIHVCLGNVAYPLNFSNLPDVDRYSCQIPVAITLNIGDVEVTPSRESLLYSEKTIKVITEKIKVVKEELKTMYQEQIKDVVGLEEYLEYKFGRTSLKLGEDLVNVSSFISNEKPANFKYRELNISDNTNLFEIAWNVHKIGSKRGRRNSTPSIKWSIMSGREVVSHYYNMKIFHTNGSTVSPNNYKKAYIKKEIDDCSNGHIVLSKRSVKDWTEKERNRIYSSLGIINYDNWNDEVTKWNIDEKKARKLVNALIRDLIKIVKKYVPTYDFEAPAEFVEAIKASRRKRTKTGDTKLSIRDYAAYEYACEIKLSALKNFRGKIFYSLKEDEDGYSAPLSSAKRAFEAIFNDDKICKPYYDMSGGKLSTSGAKKGVMFIRIRKNQVNHLEKMNHAYHAKDFAKVMLSRKYNAFLTYYKHRNLKELLINIPSILLNRDASKINSKIGEAVQTIQNELDTLKAMKTIGDNVFGYYGISESYPDDIGVNSECVAANTFKSRHAINYLRKIAEKNEETLSFFNVDENTPFTDKLVMLLDLALEI